MELHKIKEEDLLFSGECEDDRINVTARFSDYDWMNYAVDTRFHTEDIGFFAVKFEYVGITTSEMHVKTKDRYYRYLFDTSVFEKYVKRYCREFAKSFDNIYAFDPSGIVIDWFNEVIDIDRLDSDEPIESDIHIHWEWEIPNYI